MNFDMLKYFSETMQFEKIQVVGKDINLEGKPYHILGMTKKDMEMKLYVLECCEQLPSYHYEKTNRENLLESFSSERSLFLSIRNFQVNGKVIGVHGGTSGNIEAGDYCEAYVLFQRMMEAGWKILEKSPFYHVNWRSIGLTVLDMSSESHELPTWEGEVKATIEALPHTVILEIPVFLKKGEEQQIEFILESGKQAKCFINQVYTLDVWQEGRKKFADAEYQEKMLQICTKQEFNQLKQNYYDALAQTCPKGMHYMVVEYECSEDIGMAFYPKEYLDEIPKQGAGSASFLLMTAKPDREKGRHGLKLKGCIIQVPILPDVKEMEAEILTYTEMIPQWEEQLW